MVNAPSKLTSIVKDDTATVVCPVCYLARNTSVKQFRHKQHTLKAKCKCGHIFKIALEFRQYRRKQTAMHGKYKLSEPDTRDRAVKIINLSMGGACFEVRGKHDIKTGQKGTINFTLDDHKQTVVLKHVTVRTIQGNYIGCEFLEDRAYQKELGFFLKP